jgi:hypothetical protein
MITKTFPKVPGIDLCKLKGKNVMFEAGINKVQRCSEMWLGFDGAYLSTVLAAVLSGLLTVISY